MNNNYPFPPENYSDNPEYIRKVVQSVRNCVRGKTNNTGAVTLQVSSTTTVVENALCNLNSVVLLMPLTSNAAQHVNQTFITPQDKQFTITHQSNAQTDRNFRYVIIG